MLDSNFLYFSASAGSGKTHQLIKHYLCLLLKGAKPSSILALTFTKKAAKEMEDRIIQSIDGLYRNKSNKEYIKNLELFSIKDNSKEEWDRITHDIHRVYWEFLHQELNITTIDAFFQKILKNFCWYVGVEHDFTIQNEDLESIGEIFLQLLGEAEYQTLLDSCFYERQNLDSILRLCKHLDAFKESFKEELFVKNSTEFLQEDFEKSAMEYARKIQSAYINNMHKQTNCLKFDNFKELLHKGKTWLTKASLQEYRDFAKVPFDQFDQEDFINLKTCVKQALEQKEQRYLHALYCVFKVFLEAKERYYKDNNALSFDAVSSKVYTLLREDCIGKEFLYFRLDSTLSHIVIDEFQDTSNLQYSILEPLIDEIKAGKGQKNFARSFFYVGDVKQSIYRFRGGNPKLFEIASTGMEHKELAYNYRSAKHIVTFVNMHFKDKIENCIQQIPKSPNAGFVSVKSYEKETLYEGVLEVLEKFKNLNVKEDSITLLVFNNEAIVELAELLKAANYKVVIDTSAQLINHNEVRALLELLEYITTKNPIHKHAFSMLIGIELNPALEAFLQNIQNIKSPAKLILKVMEHYHIASLSAKKFLESILEYSSIEELLNDIEKRSLDIASSDFSGIRIMTIHKSKGLEFENVLVIDKIQRNSTQRSKVFFAFDKQGIQINRVFQYSDQDSDKVRKSLDCAYSHALEEQEKQEKQDLTHQLYVALTRAKTTMHILKLKEDSAFEKLALEDSTLGDFSSSQNNSPQPPKGIEEHAAMIPNRLSLKNHGRQREFQTTNTALNFIDQNPKNTYYGIALHCVLEHKLKLAIKDALLLEILKNQFGFYLNFEELEEIIKRGNLVLNNKSFIEILAKGKVECEVSFLSNGRQKRLDLLVIGEDCAWIVDYKSGKPHQSHAEQIRAYMESIRKILSKETYGYVFYTQAEQEGKLVQIV